MNFRQKFCIIFISIPILYLFHLPGIVCPGNEDQPTDTKKPSADTKKPRVRKFANLPLVLIPQETEPRFSFPRCFRQDPEGKIVDFTSSNDEKQVFFCPQSSTDRLLYPTDGKKYECEIEPEPTIRKLAKKDDKLNCIGENRDLYGYGYKLWKPQGNDKDEPFSWKEIYSFCFDKKHDQVAYVKYRILSPNLLKNRQLQRVRSYYEGVYRLEELEDESLKAYLNMIMNPLPEQKEERKKYFTTMELAHPADMILPNWKKPFYNAVNKGLLLHPLKNQWRKIGNHVRKLAEKKLGEIDIITGTFPYPNKLFFGIFWKLVIHKEKAAIAIILHNVYESDSEESSTNDTKSGDKPTEKEAQVDKPPEKDANVNVEPSEKNTNVEQNPIKKDNDDENEDNMFCKSICKEIGFGEIVPKDEKIIAFCCEPKIITNKLGLPKYEVLNLRKTPKDRLVVDDGCPKDPIPTPISEDEKPSEGLNGAEKV